MALEKLNVPARNTFLCYAWRAGLTTARINAVLAQLLTHRIIKFHIDATLIKD